MLGVERECLDTEALVPQAGDLGIPGRLCRTVRGTWLDVVDTRRNLYSVAFVDGLRWDGV